MALGSWGEDAAARAARAQGARVVARNWRTKRGELDLVLEQAGTLVFVEVKTRRSDACGTGLQAVTRRKQQRLFRAARAFIAWSRRDPDRTPCRFDVAVVDASGAVSWFEGAFSGG